MLRLRGLLADDHRSLFAALGLYLIEPELKLCFPDGRAQIDSKFPTVESLVEKLRQRETWADLERLSNFEFELADWDAATKEHRRLYELYSSDHEIVEKEKKKEKKVTKCVHRNKLLIKNRNNAMTLIKQFIEHIIDCEPESIKQSLTTTSWKLEKLPGFDCMQMGGNDLAFKTKDCNKKVPIFVLLWLKSHQLFPCVVQANGVPRPGAALSRFDHPIWNYDNENKEVTFNIPIFNRPVSRQEFEFWVFHPWIRSFTQPQRRRLQQFGLCSVLKRAVKNGKSGAKLIC